MVVLRRTRGMTNRRIALPATKWHALDIRWPWKTHPRAGRWLNAKWQRSGSVSCTASSHPFGNEARLPDRRYAQRNFYWRRSSCRRCRILKQL